jgi:hypothetical protein
MFRKPDGAGKGDAPRPTDWDKFSNNFDAIFGKKKHEQPSKTPQATNDDETDVASGVRPSDTAS